MADSGQFFNLNSYVFNFKLVFQLLLYLMNQSIGIA